MLLLQDNDLIMRSLGVFKNTAYVKPKSTVDVWSDNNRVLDSAGASEHGKWRTDRTPYLRDIMVAMTQYRIVNVMKGVQLGLSEALINTILRYIDEDPCSMLYMMPSIEMAKSLSEVRIKTAIEACEQLRSKIKNPRERDSGNRILSKAFNGGVLVLTGANSASSLRSRPVRILVMDEVDAYPRNLGEEGASYLIAQKRTNTFASDKLIARVSTPTSEASSIVYKYMQMTDWNEYHVPCVYCGTMQTLEDDRLVYSNGDYANTKIECVSCNKHIEEYNKTEMLANGIWIPKFPEHTSKEEIGFHINSLYSPLGWLSWGDIAKERDLSNSDENMKITYTNTILGLPTKKSLDETRWEELHGHNRYSYSIESIPDSIGIVTCGVDIQKGRIELEVIGWCRDKSSYSLGYHMLEGSTDHTGAGSAFEKLSDFLTRNYTRTDGVVLPIQKTAIDSGYNTSTVYSFVDKMDKSRVFAVRGVQKQQVPLKTPSAVQYTVRGKQVTFKFLWTVGTWYMKETIYANLRLAPGDPGYCRFPSNYPVDYFKGLCSEAIESKMMPNGEVKRLWVKRYRRNEPLDCRVYGMAAFISTGANLWTDDNWESYMDRVSGKKVVKKNKNFLSE